MASYKSRAPKPEKLREDETLSSFEAWRGNLEYYLALDENFAEFLEESFTWKPKSSDIHRGLTDIPIKDEKGAVISVRTAAQRSKFLDICLGPGFSFWKIWWGGTRFPPHLGKLVGGEKFCRFSVGGESAILQIYMMKTLIMTYYML